MKHLFFSTLFALVILVTGCSKDEPLVLDRDKFIGIYNGVQTYVFISGTTSSVKTVTVKHSISEGASDNEIIFDKGTGNTFNARVSGSNFDIYSQPYPINMGDGTSVNTTISGSGSLSSNKSLNLTYTLVGTVGGKSFVFSMNEVLN